MSTAENIASVQKRIATAALRAGRSPAEITLMGVSKTFPVVRIREAYAAGLRVFGENRVQEFVSKIAMLRDLPDTEWHLIGHLQTNKAAKAAELFDAVDSVDSARTAEKLNAFAEAIGKTLSVLIEINVGGEEAKRGVASSSQELEQILQGAPNLPQIGIDILSMGMSHDFEVAIEEGSTCVRVGTAIFGMRDTLDLKP